MTVHEFNGAYMPHQTALIKALIDAVNEIAPDNLTLSEVLGCLDFVSKDIHLNDYMERIND